MKRCIILVFTIVFASLTFDAAAQQGYTIKCKFVDSNGFPLIGVSLKAADSPEGSTSGLDGSITLTVKNRNTEVTASVVGYESITRKAFEFNGTIVFRDDTGDTTRQSNSVSFLKNLRMIFSRNE